MKTKRVGTISMAIILIAMGVIIFISQTNEISALNITLKLWPLMLISLGIEILWYINKLKDQDTVIKYDLFSMVVVFIILLVNISLYSLIELGVLDLIKARI